MQKTEFFFYFFFSFLSVVKHGFRGYRNITGIIVVFLLFLSYFSSYKWSYRVLFEDNFFDIFRIVTVDQVEDCCHLSK